MTDAPKTAELVARLNESADLCEFTTRAKLLREAAAALAEPRMTNNQDGWMSCALKLEAENAALAQEVERLKDGHRAVVAALAQEQGRLKDEVGEQQFKFGRQTAEALGERDQWQRRAEDAEARVRELSESRIAIIEREIAAKEAATIERCAELLHGRARNLICGKRRTNELDRHTSDVLCRARDDIRALAKPTAAAPADSAALP